jgi:hypothetical protein
MVQWRFDNGSKKEVGGLKRRYRTLVEDLTELTKIIPNPNEYGLG